MEEFFRQCVAGGGEGHGDSGAAAGKVGVSAGLTIGIAIPAYKDAEKLRRCLNSIASNAPSLLTRTVAVDDSGDGRVANSLRSEFPTVMFVVHEQNRGFGASANDAVANCMCDVVILLNDDVLLLSDPAPQLQKVFGDSDLFAMTFRSQHEDGSFREGAKRLAWPMGMPKILHNERDQLPSIHSEYPSAYAVGGHAAFSREKFLALGGFDALFDPFYWEDVDLCMRAQERGWRTAYCPECQVMHGEDGAIKSANDAARIREITQRNRLLFAWRHLPSHLRLLHRFSIILRYLTSIISGDRTFPNALRAAREKWALQNSKEYSSAVRSYKEGAHLGKD